ncbi:MAG: adenylate/guanylate cyclase domain-containing protein [Gammaproteobacteria bacterium]|nr:adenylate/guanylate cyclase domain-containing protein [Gammaproteobacteria bacterium]
MLTDKSTIEAIKKSRKQITILFSDIEHSTRHWERRGDVDARMLLDRHNRLLFPVIRKFKGKIIKTLGDAIMASFNKPENAVKAGIAIQQRLSAERDKDKYFSLRTRIGIHTGKGIVEYDDIFGDVVNVAAKVESSAEANQILITHSTRARISSDKFQLTTSNELNLTGKRKTIALYSCNWQEHKNLISNIKADSIMPLLRSQKMELITYVATSLMAVFFIYQHYLRFLLADAGFSFSWFQNTSHIPSDYPVILLLQTLTLSGFAIYLLRTDFISRTMLRVLSGLFGAGLALLLFASFNHYTDLPFKKRWYEPLYESSNLFVEVLQNNTQLNMQASKRSHIISILPKGEIFIYINSKTENGLRWDQVKISDTKNGWIPRKIRAAFGVAEEQLTRTNKFYFRYYDLYGLIIGIIAFIWGYMSFRIRPS